MSLRVCVFGSGSKGNCAYVASETTAVLIDIGLPALRVEKCLSVVGGNADEVSIVLTHAHTDHLCGVDVFLRRHPSVKVYCDRRCYPSIRKRLGSSIPLIEMQGDFFIGDITVAPFSVSHDVPCVGYSLLSGGRKVTLATDTGVFPQSELDAVSDSDLVVIESNHDPKLLLQNNNYTYSLKQRILSNRGHLSNIDSAECVRYFACHGVKQIVLAHLSGENNYPELAFETCKNYLAERGIIEGKDVKLEVARQDRMTSLFRVD